MDTGRGSCCFICHNFTTAGLAGIDTHTICLIFAIGRCSGEPVFFLPFSFRLLLQLPVLCTLKFFNRHFRITIQHFICWDFESNSIAPPQNGHLYSITSDIFSVLPLSHLLLERFFIFIVIQKRLSTGHGFRCPQSFSCKDTEYFPLQLNSQLHTHESPVLSCVRFAP